MLSRLAIALLAIGALAMMFGQVIWLVGGLLLLTIIIAELVEERYTEPTATGRKWLRVPGLDSQPANHTPPILQSSTNRRPFLRSPRTRYVKEVEGLRADPHFESTLDVYEGRLVERIPREMCVDVPEQIEVRLGLYDTPHLAHRLIGAGDVRDAVLPIVETMALALYCPYGGFRIEPLSEYEQLVIKDVIKDSELHNRDYGRWRWRVTPRRTGVTQLALRVSARVFDSHGHPAHHTLVPDKTFRIDVRINKKAIARKALWWFVVTVPAAGLVTLWNTALREELWPLVRDFIKNVIGF
jgi:hypothetical protein